MKLVACLTTLTLALLLFAGCATKQDAATDENDLGPAAPVERPDNWSRLIVRSSSGRITTDVTIDTTGHFKVDPNECLQVAYGSMKLEDWNRLSKALDQAALGTALPEEKCFTAQGEGDGFSGYAELKVTETSAPRRILQTTAGKVCTFITDEQAAREILSVLNRVLPEAYVEECRQTGA